MVEITSNKGKTRVKVRSQSSRTMTEILYVILTALHYLADYCEHNHIPKTKDFTVAIIGEYLKTPDMNIDDFMEKHGEEITKLSLMLIFGYDE